MMDDDGDDKDDSKRRTRNLSEKKRRDQFNKLVSELSTMVSANNRKMDKSTVLKSTIAFLKNHNEITVRSRADDIHEDWKPPFLSNEEFTYLVLEALEGFLMVFSTSGRIYYASESISSLLGHTPADVMDKSIFDLTFEGDRSNLFMILQQSNADAENMEQEIRFQCHLRRGPLDSTEETVFELVEFNGHLCTNTEQVEPDDMGYQPEPQSKTLFICTGRLQTPNLIRDVTLVDPSRSEFTSRHSLEWKFLFLDHRAPPIIGYLPFEVLGTSGYDYYHFDDLEKVINCHEVLMQKGELTSCYYRFLTKGQQWIWLQTRFYITYHQWNSKPEFVVCTHRVISYADLSRGMKQESTGVGVTDDELVPPEASPTEDHLPPVSPTFMSEASEAFAGSYHVSQPASVKSASASSTTGTAATAGTAPASWMSQTHTRYAAGSDTASLSGDSISSQRNQPDPHKPEESPLIPQHGIGAQYLNLSPYVNSALPVPVTAGGVIQLPAPVVMTPDQAQLQPHRPGSEQVDQNWWPRQEQLHRKHEELQQLIVRQQEELRQVKEQLLLASLGILPPIINVQPPYLAIEDVPSSGRMPPQIVYEPRPAIAAYPHTPNPTHPLPPPHRAPHQHLPQ